MAATILYTMCLLGAVALYLMLRPAPAASGRAGAVAPPVLRIVGAILGLGVFAWMLALAAEVLAPAVPGEAGRPEVFFVIFSLIALAASVRMITHHRPVYSALYFVMVVLASAALFLLLGAEFMAFALVIVYAGAILITYLFVIMLAQQAESPEDVDGQPEYDRLPREPAMAAVGGFIMLALLSTMVYEGVLEVPDAPTPREAALREVLLLNQMPRELESLVREIDPDAEVVWREREGAAPPAAVFLEDDRAVVTVQRPGEPVDRIELPPSAAPTNIHQVGLALVAKFPVSLEVAGIILLLAMFGAVVLARRQIELTEDELREAAGLQRMSPRDDADAGEGGTP